MRTPPIVFIALLATALLCPRARAQPPEPADQVLASATGRFAPAGAAEEARILGRLDSDDCPVTLTVGPKKGSPRATQPIPGLSCCAGVSLETIPLGPKAPDQLLLRCRSSIGGQDAEVSGHVLDPSRKDGKPLLSLELGIATVSPRDGAELPMLCHRKEPGVLHFEVGKTGSGSLVLGRPRSGPGETPQLEVTRYAWNPTVGRWEQLGEPVVRDAVVEERCESVEMPGVE